VTAIEQALLISIQTQRAQLKAQHPLWPCTDAAVADERLAEAERLILKPEGDQP
jgi:hypothetical protein